MRFPDVTMKLFILILTILSLAFGSSASWLKCGKSKYPDAGSMELPAPSIVGGIEARPNEFPWQVSLKKGSFQFCGGSIINEKWILTAAHCLERNRPDDVKVWIGEHNKSKPELTKKSYSIEKWILHPKYSQKVRYEHDVALIKINGTLELDENAWPVCAPEEHHDYVHLKSLTSGWGNIRVGGPSSQTLRYTTLNITTQAYCKSKYGADKISEDMICATDNKDSTVRDACQGDSGGPLVLKQKDGSFALIGIVSWGIGCASKYPGVYSRVNYVHDWILEQLEKY